MSSPSNSPSHYSKKYKKKAWDSLISSGGTKTEQQLGDALGKKVPLTRASIKILVFLAKTLLILLVLGLLALSAKNTLFNKWNWTDGWKLVLIGIKDGGHKRAFVNLLILLFRSYFWFACLKSSFTVAHFVLDRLEKIVPAKLFYHFSILKHFIFSACFCSLLALTARGIFDVKKIEELDPSKTTVAGASSKEAALSVAKFFNNYFEKLSTDSFVIMSCDALAVARILILVQKIFLVEIAHTFEQRSTGDRKKRVQPVFLSIEELRAAYVSQKLSPKDLPEGESITLFYEKMVAASEEISEEIFAAVKSVSGTEADTLTKDDFLTILGEERTDLLFDFFEGSKTNELNLEQFKRGVQLVYQDKLNIENTLNDNDEIILRIDELMVLIWRCVILFSTLVSFQFRTLYSGIAGLGSAWAISKTIEDLAKDVSNSVILLFFYHPFDIGDVITVDKTQYTVKKIGFLITTCQEGNNSLVYIKNSKLANCIIQNFRRSTDQEESLTAFVHTTTPTALLDALESELNKFLYANAKDYYPTCSFGPINVINSQRTTFSISYMHRSNFQDRKVYGARCKRFNLELFEAMKRLGIEAAPPA